MPIIRYTCLVGSFLLGMLFLLGERDTPAGPPIPDRWTSVDSLRAMAHLGEPVQGGLGLFFSEQVDDRLWFSSGLKR